jgi:hypothetical protein
MSYDKSVAGGVTNKRAKDSKDRADKMNSEMFADATLLVDFGWGWQPTITRWKIMAIENEEAERKASEEFKERIESLESHGLRYTWEIKRSGEMPGGEVREY